MSRLGSVKEANRVLRVQTHADSLRRKKDFASTRIELSSELTPYTTLPSGESVFQTEEYTGREYRTRPTALGPVELKQDLAMDNNKDGVVVSPVKSSSKKKPGKTTPQSTPSKAKEAELQDAQSTPSDSSAGDKSPSKKDDSNPGAEKAEDEAKKEPNPDEPKEKAEETPKKDEKAQESNAESDEDKFYQWVKSNYDVLLNDLTMADLAAKGLLTKQTFVKILTKKGSPYPGPSIEGLIGDNGGKKLDYAHLLKGWRGAGLRIENRKRTGGGEKSPQSVQLPPVPPTLHSPIVPFDKLATVRSDVVQFTTRVQRDRAAEKSEALASIAKNAVSPAAKKSLADACLAYSPSKAAAQKALSAN